MRPLKSILVGIDFSPCSAAALRTAMRLARAHQGVVHAIHVIDTQIALELESALTQLQGGIREGLMADARAAWGEFLKLEPEAAGLSLEISVEHRVLGVLRKAREVSADLLVLGAYGHRKPDVGVGTLATAAVRQASCDVLLVRDLQQGAFRTVVAGIDFSETSRVALERAAQIASQEGSKLHAVHIYTPPWDRYHYRAETPQADPQFLDRFKSVLGRRLEEFVQPVVGGITNLNWVCELSDAGRHRIGILEYADRIRADLICLGTRGHSNLRDALLGSTAEKALLHSRCSILAVKPGQVGG